MELQIIDVADARFRRHSGQPMLRGEALRIEIDYYTTSVQAPNFGVLIRKPTNRAFRRVRAARTSHRRGAGLWQRGP